MDTRATLQEAVDRMHALWGDHLCLDFANTVEPRGEPKSTASSTDVEIREYLTSYSDFVSFAFHAGIVAEDEALPLIAASFTRNEEAASTYERAITLREAIYRTFWCIAQGTSPSATDLTCLAREFADGAAHAGLVPEKEGFTWKWDGFAIALARPIWPLAWSAVNLLTEGDLRRVKMCPGAPDAPVPCDWLFYDTTKNRIRRWCSMSDCGGATKARRQTGRRRIERSQPNT